MEDIAIKVSKVNKTFKLPHEKQGSVKNVLLNIFRRKTYYERQQVLHDINIDIKKGEFFGIVGKNGSGKSTLLKILAGIYSPDSGSVTVQGKIIAFIELGVGFNPELTGRENVYLSGALLGFSTKEVDAMYDDIVVFAELERFMDQKLKNYSSGMQVRLAFSIAIRVKGDILILDEVLAVGDAAFQQKCYNYFEELKRRGQTVVFVSHDMGAVTRFCTRAVYLAGGKVVKEGAPAEISDLYTEANIKKEDQAPDESTQKKAKTDSKYAVKIAKMEQKKGSVEFTFRYKSPKEEPMVIGIAFVKDGAPIAEVCTDKSMHISGKGLITYTLDTSIFNSGIFSVAGVSLFSAADKELLAVANQTKEFVVKGVNKNRGGAVTVTESWKNVSN